MIRIPQWRMLLLKQWILVLISNFIVKGVLDAYMAPCHDDPLVFDNDAQMGYGEEEEELTEEEEVREVEHGQNDGSGEQVSFRLKTVLNGCLG